MRLTTRRLVLRSPGPQDFEAVLALVSDYEVVKYTATWPHPADPDRVRNRLERPVAAERGWSALIEREGRVIGQISVFDGALGYMLERAAWGQGYASEAAAAMLANAFATLPELTRITAGLFDGNDASARVLARCGFRLTGRGRLHCAAQRRELEGPDYAITRAQWADQQPLDTARLRLRSLGPADAPALQRILADFEVARWLCWPEQPFRLETAEALCCRPPPWVLAVEHGGETIGCITVAEALGYWLDRRFHGQGLATEAATALVCRHFAKGGPQLHSNHILGNTASRRILLRLGFRDWTTEMRASVPLGREVEVQEMLLTPADWAALCPAIGQGN